MGLINADTLPIHLATRTQQWRRQRRKMEMRIQERPRFGGTEAANLFMGEVYSQRLSGSEESNLLSLYVSFKAQT
jgi:hypothetical protein